MKPTIVVRSAFALGATLLALACERPSEPASDTDARVARSTVLRGDEAREVSARQQLARVLGSRMNLMRQPEIRAQLDGLHTMLQKREITPLEFNDRAVQVMDAWAASHPDEIRRLRAENPERWDRAHEQATRLRATADSLRALREAGR